MTSMSTSEIEVYINHGDGKHQFLNGTLDSMLLTRYGPYSGLEMDLKIYNVTVREVHDDTIEGVW